MSIATAGDGIRAVTLEQLQVSTANAQAERRKHFEKGALGELAASIKSHGLLSPIIARPVNGHFEVVAGERRMLAAKIAGLSAISVDVRTLTDEQVLEIQLIENLQREGLHPLAEAEGYEQLHGFGHSTDEIADKVGKSKAYVYARIKLLALGPAPREAFYAGRVSPSIALLLARIPVASLQRDACGQVTQGRYGNGEPMSFREARDHIEHNYMLRLSEAPFPTKDAEILPKVGACGPCPKRTGNQSDLFADIKSADVCTDPGCFKLKREAWGKLQIAKAKESGQRVITGGEAKKIMDGYGDNVSYSSGFASLDSTCHDDPKHRTFKQLLGKDAQTVLVQSPKTGVVIEVIEKSSVVKQLKKDGVIKPRESTLSSGSPARRKLDAGKAKIERQVSEQIFLAIHAKAPKKLTQAILVRLVDHELDAIGPSELFEKAWDLKPGFGIKGLEKLSESQLSQMLFEIDLLEELDIYDAAGPVISKAAKDLGVDVKKIRAGVVAAAEPTKKAKGKKK